MDFNTIIKKANRVMHEEGWEMLVRKGGLFLRDTLTGNKRYSEKELVHRCVMDVLFINGCYLSHPSRYRVAHQREQLSAVNISNAEVFYTELDLNMVKNYRMFIFYRCPYTDMVGDFINKAKKYNKRTLFDIDDLVIDTKYTNEIEYIQKMSVADRKIYDEGVTAIGKTLSLCDGAITTTESLACELKKFVPDVYVNRNVMSDVMVELSKKAVKEKVTTNKEKILLGYFSGSITHNPDIIMILPAIINIFNEYPNVELNIIGELDLPEQLEPYRSRIKSSSMVNWKKLPELIASVDINLAPLEDNLFNRAKSENKWTEAALVNVPTIASNVGAFAQIIEHETTGYLCNNTVDEWYKGLKQLIEDRALRTTIGLEANRRVNNCHTTISTAVSFGKYIKDIMSPNIIWLLPVMQISGGALVTLKHAGIMQDKGFDVSIFNYGYEKITEVAHEGHEFPVIPLKDLKISLVIDKCVATLWSTCEFFETYGNIKRRYYLVQNYETDFYEHGNPFRLMANQTYCLPMQVQYITISKWCVDWLEQKYKVKARYAPNGLDVNRFYPEKRNFSGKIRILVEGNSEDYYKNVDESFHIVERLDKDKFEIWYMSYLGKPKAWYRVDKFFHKVPYDKVPDIYRQCHILIKSSILESFSYPPLEMMATGGLVVLVPNDGNIEYLEDEKNCLFYKRGNIEQAIIQIERLISDEILREHLIIDGVDTAKARDWTNISSQIEELYK